jgi:hypothetical protein
MRRQPIVTCRLKFQTVALILCAATTAQAQRAPSSSAASAAASQTAASADSVRLSPHYWRYFAAGFGASILLHEAGHVGMSYALGAHPTFGFNKGRPTIYSGISATADPHKQFLFSSIGLTLQALLDEGILDVPHHRGSAFERGVLGGGIGTTLFYLTIGRVGSVSDVAYMSRTHALTGTEVTLLFGGVAAMHTFRIARDRHYANFFARPEANGSIAAGVSISPGP